MSDDLLPELASRPITPTRVIPAQPPAVDRTPVPEPEAPPGNRLRTIRPGRPYWASNGPAPAAPESGPTVLLGARTITPEPPPERPKRDKTRSARRQRRRERPARPQATPPPLIPDDHQAATEPQDEPDTTTRTGRFRARIRRQHPPTVDHRLPDQRRRDRLKNAAVTATAAGIGWQIYLGPAYTEIIHTAGRISPKWAVGTGLLLILGGLIIEASLRQGVHVRDADMLGLAYITIARIPLGTALLALALYAPGTL